MKYKEYSEEAYQSILSYVMKSVEIDENDPYIKRLYIAAARVPKFSIEYSCEDISLVMPKIEKAVWAWEKENTEGVFFVDGGENCWMVKNQVEPLPTLPTVSLWIYAISRVSRNR